MLNIQKLDRFLIVSYLVAILLLLLLPIPEREFNLLGIKGDKWLHAALFGGFAFLLHWNLSRVRYASAITLVASLVLALVTETAQGMTGGRNVELLDIVADLVGGVLGTVVMTHILSSRVPDKTIGLFIAILGLVLAVLSLTADMVGGGNTRYFGPGQMAGTLLGMIVLAGGMVVHFKGLKRVH